MLITTVLLINTIIVANAFILHDNQTFRESKASDFIFETPDVVKEYLREDGTSVRLDAYKTSKNQELTSIGQFTGLRWVSLGKPEIVNVNSNQQSIY